MKAREGSSQMSNANTLINCVTTSNLIASMQTRMLVRTGAGCRL